MPRDETARFLQAVEEAAQTANQPGISGDQHRAAREQLLAAIPRLLQLAKAGQLVLIVAADNDPDVQAQALLVRPGSALDPRPRPAPQPYQIPGGAPARGEYDGDYRQALATLIRWAYDDGVEISGLVGDGLRDASVAVGGTKVLLARRPGSWEAGYVRQLAADLDADWADPMTPPMPPEEHHP